MARGTAAEVAAQVRERVARLNAAGGYMPGVSNTVPSYVRAENYARMRAEVLALAGDAPAP